MPTAPIPVLADVGYLNFAVYGSGTRESRLFFSVSSSLHAIALLKDEILLLSIVGPETSVKALTAGLRSSGQTQKRIDYSAHVGHLHQSPLTRCPDGYRVYRSKMPYGLWHVLCLAKREGFLPVLSEETVWQALRTETHSPLAGMDELAHGGDGRAGLIETLTQAGSRSRSSDGRQRPASTPWSARASSKAI